MPTALPAAKPPVPADIPSMPIPLCMGAPAKIWSETLRTEKDARQFWFGYAIGGAVCVILLAVEVVVIIILL
jgi:hypothetical protein